MLPANPRVWYGLAKTYEGIGRKELASDAWERLKALPPSLQSHMHSAELHNAALRWREAALEWQEALKMAPEDASVPGTCLVTVPEPGLRWRPPDLETSLDGKCKC